MEAKIAVDTLDSAMDIRFSRRFERLAVVAILVLYTILAVELARVRPPNADEGNHGSVAAIFASHHYLSMPMLNGVWLPGLDKHLYAIMPLYFLGLSVWLKAFGVNIITMRLFSIPWGMVALLSWYVIMRRLSGDRRIALLSLALIALNYDFIDLSSGRYDVMCAALNAAALAIYLALRERHLPWVLFSSNLLVAAAFMTHPYGLFGFVGLLLFVLALDRRRIGWKELAVSAIPYFAALAAWAAYIAQDPAVFKAQFFSNVSTRVPRSGPFSSLAAELTQRYIVQVAGWRPDVPVYMRIKVLILLGILVSMAGCLVSGQFRKNPRYRLLLALTAIWFLMLTFLEPSKQYNYSIHIWPAYFALMAVWLGGLISRRGWFRVLAGGCVGLLILFPVASVAYRAKLDTYHKAFLPALSFLEQNVHGDDLVVGPGEFGFGLGFAEHVLDDMSLGYDGKKAPDFIVIDNEYEHGEALFPKDSARWAHIQSTLSTYRLVFASGVGYQFYRIYARAS